eukprot:2709854-Heterocapsa_arctica.AAC.1
MTVKTLNQIAKEKGLTGCSRLRKELLIERLRSRSAIDQAVGPDTSYRAIDQSAGSDTSYFDLGNGDDDG